MPTNVWAGGQLHRSRASASRKRICCIRYQLTKRSGTAQAQPCYSFIPSARNAAVGTTSRRLCVPPASVIQCPTQSSASRASVKLTYSPAGWRISCRVRPQQLRQECRRRLRVTVLLAVSEVCRVVAQGGLVHDRVDLGSFRLGPPGQSRLAPFAEPVTDTLRYQAPGVPNYVAGR
jgi:hypothetical protein